MKYVCGAVGESWSHENSSRRLVVGRYSWTQSRLMAVQLALLYSKANQKMRVSCNTKILSLFMFYSVRVHDEILCAFQLVL
jgi:hypothetical protein